ncbi:MAG: type II/IV secretion system protein [Peptostreptococcaceae bacterium]|nr:type II/IV secretion system protein [Peptostreptococcaceae bacterium]
MVNGKLARKYNAIPIDIKGNDLEVAISKDNLYALEDFRLATGKNIIFKTMKEDEISRSIEKYYSKNQSIESDFSKDILENILQKAVLLNASDIHIEPFEKLLKIRMRVDGSLKEINTYNIELHSQLSTLIKLLAGMNIAEKRLPQDGRIDKDIDNNIVDLRISTIPTVYGEKIVIRILNRNTFFKSKYEIGFSDEAINKIKSMTSDMSGLIIVTGPTGSGKTTTLYSILNDFKNIDKNIVTIEDPVEYKIEGINQIQVNYKYGLDFATGLKSILRQDPDIIMIGEIRDKETAQIAIRAASTGHLVISTMHTNNSVESISRLVDMGVPRYLISSVLKGVISQKLVRKVCGHCSIEEELDENTYKKLKLKTIKIEQGCSKCNYSGYKGRIAVYEILEINKRIKHSIIDSELSDEIYNLGKLNGMISFQDSCSYLLKNGITTLKECMFMDNIN